MIKEFRRQKNSLIVITDSGQKEIDLFYQIEQAFLRDDRSIIVLLGSATKLVVSKSPDGKNDIIRTDVIWADRNIKCIDENAAIRWEVEDDGETKPQPIVGVPQHYHSMKLVGTRLRCCGHRVYDVNPLTGKIVDEIKTTQHKKLDDRHRLDVAHPSDTFKQFLYQYFDRSMIWRRGEADPELVTKLEGKELACAIKLLVHNIDAERIHILLALKVLDYYEVIDQIKKVVNSTDKESFQIMATHLLHQWIGDPNKRDFAVFCKKRIEETTSAFNKTLILDYARKLDEENALSIIWTGLNDMDFHVRACAFRNLRVFYGIASEDVMRNDPEYYPEMMKFVSDEVFDDKKLFKQRLESLSAQVQVWKTKKIRPH